MNKLLSFSILVICFVLPLNVEAQAKHTKEWMHEAIQASIKGNVERAKTILRAILKVHPNHVFALNNLGKIYLDGKEFEKAIALLKKAWKLNPKFYVAGNTLGDAYSQMGEYEKAEEVLKKIIKMAPDFELSYANLGEVYFRQKKFDKAEKLLKKALNLMPSLKRPKLFLSKILEAKKNKPN